MKNQPTMLSSIDEYYAEVEQQDSLLSRLSPLLQLRQRISPSLLSEYPVLSAKAKRRIDNYRAKLLTIAGIAFCFAPQWISKERPPEREIEAHDFELLRPLSIPGGQVLEELDKTQAERFSSIIDVESIASKKSDNRAAYANAILLHTVSIEGFINKIFTPDSEVIADQLFEQLQDNQASILSESYSKERQTLGSLQLLCIGLHRAVREKIPTVIGWVLSKFSDRVSRHRNEKESTLSRMSTGNLSRYLGRMREKYRNPLVHADSEIKVGRTEYRAFCDLSYGTKDLKQWIDLGVNPEYYAPINLGWVSFLATGANKKKSNINRTTLI